MAMLAIETSSRQMGVAVLEGERLISSYELLADYPHAVELPGAVTRVLQAARATVKALEAVIVDIGPGSFTGCRIGLAFVKALVFSAKIPVVGVASLDVLAANASCAPQLVCPILDARQGNLYAAQYRVEQGRLIRQGDAILEPAEQCLSRITEPALWLGDGCGLHREQILRRCPEAVIAPVDLWLPRAAALARLGAEQFRQGHRDDPATLVPLYLYPRDCSVRGPNRPTAVLKP